jgi:signal transduction histidine kinase
MMRAFQVHGLLRLLPLIVLALGLVILARLDEPQLGRMRVVIPGPDPVQHILALVAGVAMVSAGVGALASGVLARSGTLALLAGLTWFGADIARLAIGLPVLRSLLITSTVLVLPLMVHIALSVAPWVRRRPLLRAGVMLLDVAVVAVAAAAFLTYAPFDDPVCLEGCAFRTEIVNPGPAARAAIRDSTQLVSALAASLLVVVSLVAWVDGQARTPSRAAILGGAILAGTGGAAWAASRFAWGSTERSRAAGEVAWMSFAALCTGMLVVALGLGLEVARQHRARSRLRDITEGLTVAATLGSLESELAAALDDADLGVGYPVDDSGTCVDASGAPVELVAGAGQAVTVLSRAGTDIAIVRHHHDVDGRVLTDAFGPSLLVALDNERLRAVRMSRLHDLRQSRMRIVELADAERRRIERDLHDGAQQRLLAVAFDLRLARVAAEREGRPDTAMLHADAEAMALSIVEDLRRLCRGIHPQVLSQAGLGPALISLADGSEIPLEVSLDPMDRPPLAVETAAYEVVIDAMAQAVSRGASALDVSIERADRDLIVETTDGVTVPTEARLRLADRVGAVGGVLSAGVSSDGGYLRAVLPCG